MRTQARSHGEIRLAAMARKRDIKQFMHACQEAGLTASERFEASDALHAEKRRAARKT